eukprot:Seg5077.1 transcript_id=Seg5077.1/GoldUCD/mRNA.D3Y31 product="Polypeptide N-acetylgalactosaminyltransferase 2" protein_id=Seg5077.1/GoldUCD/D3Y31
MRSVLFVYAAVISFLVLCVVYIVKNKEFVTTVAFYSTNVNDEVRHPTKQAFKPKMKMLEREPESDCRFAFGFLKKLLKDVRPELKPVIQPAFERPFTGALKQEGLCADSMDGAEGDVIGMGPCHGQGRNQEWTFTKNKQIRSEGRGTLCLTWDERLHGKKKNIILQKCNHVNIKQKWQLDNVRKHIIPTINPRLCVTNVKMTLVLVKCEPSLRTQNWNVVMTELLNIELQAESND